VCAGACGRTQLRGGLPPTGAGVGPESGLGWFTSEVPREHCERVLSRAAGPFTERKRNKRADGGGTHSSWMRLIQNRPMQQAACSLCACLARVHRYRPLLGMPRRRAGGRLRPVCSLPVLIINCDREFWLHSFTRLTKSSRQPGRPASSHCFGRVAQSRHAQDRPGEPRRVSDFNQPAFDNVRHKRYHKRLPVSRNGPDMSDSTMGIGLNGGSVRKFLFTLLTEQADILFAEEVVRLSVEQVLTFFSNDSPRDDLWVRMTLLLKRSQNQSRR